MHLRSMTAAAVLLFAASAAHASTAEELIAAINKCAAIPDTATRHVCYDGLPAVVKSLTAPTAAQSPAATPMPSAPQTAAIPQAPAAAPAATPAPGTQPESKGFWTSLFDSDDEPPPADVIAATVESYTFDSGLFVVTLDNGQIWRQITAQSGLLPLSHDRKNKVKVWRNARGEFVLRIDELPTRYHVRRAK